MKAKEFKQLIKECVREVIKEELTDILYEGLKSMNNTSMVREQASPFQAPVQPRSPQSPQEKVDYSPVAGLKQKAEQQNAGALSGIINQTAMEMSADDFDDVSVSGENQVAFAGGGYGTPNQDVAPQSSQGYDVENSDFLNRVHNILEMTSTNM